MQDPPYANAPPPFLNISSGFRIYLRMWCKFLCFVYKPSPLRSRGRSRRSSSSKVGEEARSATGAEAGVEAGTGAETEVKQEQEKEQEQEHCVTFHNVYLAAGCEQCLQRQHLAGGEWKLMV